MNGGGSGGSGDSLQTVETIQRGYVDGKKRPAGQVRRVHVVRTEGPAGWEPGKQTMCGQAAWTCYQSSPLVRSTPHELPGGLAWCPKCIGLLAERLGRLGEIARVLGVEGGDGFMNGGGSGGSGDSLQGFGSGISI